MGQKIHPLGFRVGITEEWRSRWYAPKAAFGEFLGEDFAIRKFIDERLNRRPPYAAVSRVNIDRTRNDVKVVLHTARPGLVIGPKGAEVDKLKEALEDLIDRKITVNIMEIKAPDRDANLVAESIAEQLKKRAGFRRVLKQRAESAMATGVLGVKIMVSGRLGGAEMARKEKLIREIFINDDVIEAIIGLPPGLFYGTGIPACVLVCNKNKPDELENKVLFINADREYAEGKAQNKLRPEDIEKIDFVFTHKREIPKYSRLVDRAEIAEKNDYNLNIRRYVDNTPDPEPEDVQAHLIGGIPEDEVATRNDDFARFGVDPELLFEPERPGYLAFSEFIDSKPAIKIALETDPAVQQTLATHFDALEAWWIGAREDFAQLQYVNNGGKKMPEVRSELLASLKHRLVPLGVLDEFKSAGVFVNWWQQIRYDLKTIISIGWHHSLIPDEYLIAEFFQAEADEIETLEAAISDAQGELAEAVETAQEVAAYEPDEDEKVTAAVIKKALKALIDDLKDTPGESAKRELKRLRDQDKAIKNIEKRIKDAKATLKVKTSELEFKLKLKRLGGEGFKAESLALILQADAQIADLDPKNKDDKKKITVINKDKEVLAARIAQIDTVLAEIGGQISEEDARQLILNKIYDIALSELDRYLNAEKRLLIQGVENLWDKYAVSSQELEGEQESTLKTLDGFLSGLGYLA